VTVATVLANQVIGHVREIVEFERLAQVVELRPGRLLAPQRAPPFPDEVLAVQGPAALEPHQRVLRIDDRTDRDDLLEPQSRLRSPRADSKAEIAPSENPTRFTACAGSSCCRRWTAPTTSRIRQEWKISALRW